VEIVGKEHNQTALDAQTLLKKAVSLDRIVSLIGETELSAQDQTLYKRAKFLKNYMTQYFTVVEPQTGRKGVQVSRKETVSDIRAILDGKVDNLQPEDLLYIATLKDVEEKLKKQITKTAAANQNMSKPAQPKDQQTQAQAK
jgi:F0F1-type ATP synthase beta subunit